MNSMFYGLYFIFGEVRIIFFRWWFRLISEGASGSEKQRCQDVPHRPPPQCKQRQTDMWQLLHLPWRMLIQNFTGRESCCEIMSHQHIGWSAPAIAHIHRSRRGCRCLRRGILEHTLHDTLSVSQTTIFSKHKHALSGALAVVHRGS